MLRILPVGQVPIHALTGEVKRYFKWTVIRPWRLSHPRPKNEPSERH